MMKYIKNKNFIPTEFIEKLNINENKKNNKLISILIILNIIIIPTSVNKVVKNKDNAKVYNNNLETNQDIEKGIKRENIETWINNISPNMLNMNVQNNNGSIKVKKKEDVFEIEEKNIIKINTIIKDEENNFIIEVGI